MCVNLRQNIQNWPKGAKIGQNCLVKSTAPPVVTYISYDLHRSGTPGISTILRLSGGCTSFQWWCWYIYISVVVLVHLQFSGLLLHLHTFQWLCWYIHLHLGSKKLALGHHCSLFRVFLHRWHSSSSSFLSLLSDLDHAHLRLVLSWSAVISQFWTGIVIWKIVLASMLLSLRLIILNHVL